MKDAMTVDQLRAEIERVKLVLPKEASVVLMVASYSYTEGAMCIIRLQYGSSVTLTAPTWPLLIAAADAHATALVDKQEDAEREFASWGVAA